MTDRVRIAAVHFLAAILCIVAALVGDPDWSQFSIVLACLNTLLGVGVLFGSRRL